MTVLVSVQQCLLVDGWDVHECADAIMEHLVELSETEGSRVLDSAVDADSEEGSVMIEVTVTAEDLGEAVNTAIAAMRTAVHATGGNTAEWLKPGELQELVDSVGTTIRVSRLAPVA